jgi:hypothetical protein
MPSAAVDAAFMQKFTPANQVLLATSAAIVLKKKKAGPADQPQLEKKRKVSIIDPVNANGVTADVPSSSGATGATSGSNASPSTATDVKLDPTQGGRCLPTPAVPHTANSVLFPLLNNRKQLQKAIDNLDPTTMEITCDFDLWAWIEAQKLFAPFSYKSHDMSVLALQGMQSSWTCVAFLHCSVLTVRCAPYDRFVSIRYRACRGASKVVHATARYHHLLK